VGIHTRFHVGICIVIIIPFFLSGCITDIFHLRPKRRALPEKTIVQKSHPKPSPVKPEKDNSSPPKDDKKYGTESKVDTVIDKEEPISLVLQNEEKDKSVRAATIKGNQETTAPAEKKDRTESKVDTVIDKEEPISSVRQTEQEGYVTPSKDLEGSSQSSPQQTPEETSQTILDSALEFCQVSYDFWQQGDLPNAIDALDQAYSLILKVNSEENPEILQQRDDLRYTISKRIMEVYSSRFTVVNGHNKVIPLVMNGHVERALSVLKGRERKFFLKAYRRSGRYRPAIVKALKKAGLPEELSWLPLIESGFKIRALSRARALGLWQFIASTGYKFGLKRDWWVDERMDPEKSTIAAIAYLKELHQIFGDWTTALAAYNCGEGTVLKCIQTQKISYLDNFWDLYQKLPVETAFYVPKFLAVLHILNDPEAHGFILPPLDEEIETEDVAINKQVHLKTISRYLDVPYETLKDLNPSLRHYYTPNRAYILRVPQGKKVTLLSKLDDIPTWHPPVSAYVRHRVRKGESLSVIAQKYRTSVRAIMYLNRLRSSHFIRAGWTLKIPVKRRYASLKRIPSPNSGLNASQKVMAYVVRKGDSLWKIANRFGTTTKAIQSVNKLNTTPLSIGQELMIPQDQKSFMKIETRSYTVSKGDSPHEIARKYHMKLSDFLRINNLSPRSTIYPGQVLLIKAY
jgi:membrane-bound lytic murein transglycosylase D